MSRAGDRSSPSGVAPPKAGKALRFRLRLATMRRIGEIRRANFLERGSGPRSRLDRHRGDGHPPTPATPPCVRVRTRRFELVTLAPLDQRRKSE